MAKTLELSELTSTRSKKSVKSKAKTRITEEPLKAEKKKKKKKKKTTVLDISSDIDVKKKKKKKTKDKSLSKEEKRDKRKRKLKESARDMTGHLEVMLKENPNIKEHDQFQEYVYIFESLQDIARIKEEQCRGNKAQSKDVYALMQVYNQMRDVIADIRALRDISQVADQLCEDVLAPFAQTSASILMDFYQGVEQLARRSLNDDQVSPFIKQLKMFAKASGISMQGAYEVSNQKTLEVLSDQ